MGWGAPRIHGERLKLGVKYLELRARSIKTRYRRPRSQTRRTFIENHADCLAAIDFFIVPSVTLRVLYVLIVLSHDRRHIVHFNVSAHPCVSDSSLRPALIRRGEADGAGRIGTANRVVATRAKRERHDASFG